MIENYFCDPPIIQSAIAGISKSEFCQKMLDSNAGMVTLGGFSIDRSSSKATREIIKRGREEFLLPEKESQIHEWCTENIQLKKTRLEQKITVNLRVVRIDEMSEIWLKHLSLLTDYLEINAHCRQKEIT